MNEKTYNDLNNHIDVKLYMAQTRKATLAALIFGESFVHTCNNGYEWQLRVCVAEWNVFFPSV